MPKSYARTKDGKNMQRAIVEKFLGRKLGKDEVVHHINGKTKDNRITNLQVMTRKEHASFHRTKEARKKYKRRSNEGMTRINVYICDKSLNYLEELGDTMSFHIRWAIDKYVEEKKAVKSSGSQSIKKII